jgi:hypothetical protein
MNASSESGLWPSVISRDFMRGVSIVIIERRRSYNLTNSSQAMHEQKPATFVESHARAAGHFLPPRQSPLGRYKETRGM